MAAENENLRINQVVMHEVGAAARTRPCELSLSHAASVKAVNLQVLPVEVSWVGAPPDLAMCHVLVLGAQQHPARHDVLGSHASPC